MNNNSKGFTLAELLVVVSIIGTLTGISIPVFNSQLEKSREASDAANIRSQYAEVMAQALMIGDDANIDASEYPKIVLSQTQDAWQDSELKENLYGLFAEIVTDSNSENEPIANGTAWVEYIYETDVAILHYSSSNNVLSKSEIMIADADNFTGFLNAGSNVFGAEFTWTGGWGSGKNYSLGKALVSGKGNEDIKNALIAQGDLDAANKAYTKNQEKSSNPSKYNDLKNYLVSESGFDQLYKSYGAYTIIAQTKEDMDGLPKNGTVVVTEYLMVEGQNRKDSSYPTNGYAVIGVREVTYEMSNGKVVSGYSSNIEDWTVVPVDSNTFK